MPPRKKKDDPMAAVDALPLVQELEKALACLDAVEKDVDEGKRPGKDMDAFFQQLGRVDDAAAALPEMPIPQGALDDGADLDVVARQDLRRQLDDLAAEGHRKKNKLGTRARRAADLVEAGLFALAADDARANVVDLFWEFPQGQRVPLLEALDERRPELPPALPGQGHLRHRRLIHVVRDGHPALARRGHPA